VEELLLSAIECTGSREYYADRNSHSRAICARADFEVAIRKMKRYKAPGSDQIAAELIQAGGETLLSEIHKLIMLI
jgi:hypothetical protein